MIRIFNIARYERGLLFSGRDFVGVLGPGRYLRFDPLWRLRIFIEDVTEPMLEVEALDVIVASRALGNDALVVDVKDGERALVWIDGRFANVLVPGLYAFWTILKDVRVELVDATKPRVPENVLTRVVAAPLAVSLVDRTEVPVGSVGLYFLNGAYQETLSPGSYAFWKGEGKVEVRLVDLREQLLDVSGQEILTLDKVTLRLNAVITYRVTDARKAVDASFDFVQATYREAQLALRAVIGTRTLDAILEDRDGLTRELEELARPGLAALGCTVGSIGIRDVILPGEMKELLNKVTEAKKAAEANLITRREETAAVRSQLNAARIIESSPTLLRLRELEVLEKVTEKARLNVILGAEGLADKVVKLL
jgi:regulator of protease activity HflC (stomatin/prohibitin superfamily)